jgi:hypothetical protein
MQCASFVIACHLLLQLTHRSAKRAHISDIGMYTHAASDFRYSGMVALTYNIYYHMVLHDLIY